MLRSPQNHASASIHAVGRRPAWRTSVRTRNPGSQGRSSYRVTTAMSGVAVEGAAEDHRSMVRRVDQFPAHVAHPVAREDSGDVIDVVEVVDAAAGREVEQGTARGGEVVRVVGRVEEGHDAVVFEHQVARRGEGREARQALVGAGHPRRAGEALARAGVAQG
jgi:hypothetical protein